MRTNTTIELIAEPGDLVVVGNPVCFQGVIVNVHPKGPRMLVPFVISRFKGDLVDIDPIVPYRHDCELEQLYQRDLRWDEEKQSWLYPVSHHENKCTCEDPLWTKEQ